MRFNGRNKLETYGELTESNSGFDPGQGFIILEVQKKLLRFLVECCRLILQDLPKPSLTDDTVLVQPEPDLPPTSDNSTPSLASMASETAYRLPARLDWKRLQTLIDAKRSAAEDHVWNLREDPAYFADVAGDISEHRSERAFTVNGGSIRFWGSPCSGFMSWRRR